MFELLIFDPDALIKLWHAGTMDIYFRSSELEASESMCGIIKTRNLIAVNYNFTLHTLVLLDMKDQTVLLLVTCVSAYRSIIVYMCNYLQEPFLDLGEISTRPDQ